MNPLETRGIPSRVILWVLLVAALVLYGFPFVYLLLTSFKTPLDAIAVPPTVMPETWTLENYVSALSRAGVLRPRVPRRCSMGRARMPIEDFLAD